MDKKSTTKIGDEYAEEFGEFMKKELGYNKYYPKRDVASNILEGNATNEIDIVAERLINRGDELRNAARKVLIGCVVIVALGGITTLLNFTALSKFLLYSGFSSFVTTLLLSYLVHKYTVEHAWVECKAWEKKIGKDEIRNMNTKFEEYKKSKDKRFYFTQKYFVSKEGYYKPARDYGEENNIFCYMGKNPIFVESPSNWVGEKIE